MLVSGRRNYQNQKFLRATSEQPNTTSENTTKETLQTTKWDKEYKVVTQSPCQGDPSLMKDVQQEERTGTKNNKMESMKAKSEVRVKEMAT